MWAHPADIRLICMSAASNRPELPDLPNLRFADAMFAGIDHLLQIRKHAPNVPPVRTTARGGSGHTEYAVTARSAASSAYARFIWPSSGVRSGRCPARNCHATSGWGIMGRDHGRTPGQRVPARHGIQMSPPAVRKGRVDPGSSRCVCGRDTGGRFARTESLFASLPLTGGNRRIPENSATLAQLPRGHFVIQSGLGHTRRGR